MAQRRRRAELREVALARDHQAPVLHVEERAEEVAAQSQRLVVGGDERAEQRDGDQHEEEGGQEPPGPPEPEAPERDAAGAFELPEQQRGDEESREHEEHVDADEPALGPGSTPPWKSITASTASARMPSRAGW